VRGWQLLTSDGRGATPELCVFMHSCIYRVHRRISEHDEKRILIHFLSFENRVLIFGPKREEDGSWRKLHND
jgi:hypothetical protein